ncbi:MAG: hypothetical protein AAGU15_04420 [Anaerolineaceae bacterium]
MSYCLHLFSPFTYDEFLSAKKYIPGFRPGLLNAAKKLQPGDILVCYLTKVSRWVAALQVTGELYEDHSPRFATAKDPFVLRVRAMPLVLLDPRHGIPVKENIIWNNLSFTAGQSKEGSRWTGPFRSSLRLLNEEDGAFLLSSLQAQAQDLVEYPLNEKVYQKYAYYDQKNND